MNRFRTIALTAIAGLVLVACGSAASGSQSPGGGASQPASQPASQVAQASQGGPEASFSQGVVSDLEAMIPDKVGDITITKTSMRGNEYLVAADSDPATIKFIQDLGVSPSDISMALGSGYDQTAGSFTAMFVLRAAGADPGRLLSAFESAMNADTSSPVQWTDATVGGKQVKLVAADSGNTYVYAKGDVVFWIIASVDADAVEVISNLP